MENIPNRSGGGDDRIVSLIFHDRASGEIESTESCEQLSQIEGAVADYGVSRLSIGGEGEIFEVDSVEAAAELIEPVNGIFAGLHAPRSVEAESDPGRGV